MPSPKKYLQVNKKGYKLSLDIVTYDEEEKKIAYAPALDLAGIGSDDQEAIRDLMKVVALTFNYARTKGTFEVMLFDLGWRKISDKAIEPPSFTDEEITKKLNVHHIRRYDEQPLAIPA
jgi:hypothetical protein